MYYFWPPKASVALHCHIAASRTSSWPFPDNVLRAKLSIDQTEISVAPSFPVLWMLIHKWRSSFESCYPRSDSTRFKSALIPSAQRIDACLDSGASPSSRPSIRAGRNANISRRVLPVSHSVNADPAAIDAVHPRTLYRASAAISPSKRTESRKISPHAGFDTSTVVAGAASSPTLRGF